MCQQMFYNGTVDDWIETYFGVRSDDSTPAGSYSHNATALPDDVSAPSVKSASYDPLTHPYSQLYDALVAPGATVATEASFVSAYNGTLAAAGGPFPE
jgi:hypothetical protein